MIYSSFHFMLLCGVGIENGVPYWELQESYGEERGQEGYMGVGNFSFC